MFTSALALIIGSLLNQSPLNVIEVGTIPRVLVVSPEVLTGPTPERDLAALAEYGIKTIVSVDAARPPADAARALGMRYVHLPLSYNGIDSASQHRLAKAVRDLPSPIYVHCHRGQHRGPTATAVALVALDRIDQFRALKILEIAGTSKRYPGLYSVVHNARPLQSASIDAVTMSELPEIERVGKLRTVMDRIDRVFIRLHAIETAHWTTPISQPDLLPAVEAGLLTDLFRQASEIRDVGDMRAEFAAITSRASQLEDAIVEGRYVEATDLLGGIASDCRACHEAHRYRKLSSPSDPEVP